MTVRAFSATLLLLPIAFAPSGALAQEQSQLPPFKIAGRVLPPDQAQQKANDEDPKDKKGKRPPGNDGNKDGRRNDGRGQGQGPNGGPPKRDAGPGPIGPGKFDKNTDRAKNDGFQKKLEADQARQNAVKQKQFEIQQAKEKAFKQKQDADSARQNAVKQKQFEIQQAKEKAFKQKQDADFARQNAVKQKQLEIQQAKEKDKPKQPTGNFMERQIRRNNEAAESAAREKAARDNAAKAKRDFENTQRNPIEKAKDFDRNRDQPKGDRKPFKFDRANTDREFERARSQAQRQRGDGGGPGRFGDKENWRDGSDKKFEVLRKGRKERDFGSRSIITEPDKRVIVRRDNRAFIRHDESSRLQRTGRELRRERRKDGTLMIVTMGLAGALIYSLQDDDGRVLRRSRKDRDGREAVLFDNRHYYRDHSSSQFGPDRYYDNYIDLPPPVVRIPRDKYIVDYDRASPEDIYDALNAPPIESLERGYSLDEVRRSYPVLERMRRVDLDTINFEFGSWDVERDQFNKLERIADAIRRILDRSPDEVFLIEGHTDAVGSDVDNLSLSDRRAETVAVILSETFGIPPENLTTQGYGEEHLKVFTEEPSRINRRVSLRRITPLLSREGINDDWDQSTR
jgi:outer membrane protein OmpA-like peptidoglycan-associated protein